MDNERTCGSHGEKQKCNNAGAKSAFAEGCKEAMAGLKPDGIYKNDDADDVNIFRQAQAMIESAKNHPNKENGSHSEPESEETDIANQITQTDDRKQHQQRILHQ